METKSRDVSPPLGAISTWDEVRCRLEVKLPVYAAIPPREGDDSLLQYRSPFRVEKASEVNGHIIFHAYPVATHKR